jgi:deoxyadenosine/deoxycytidine kinase
MKGFNMKKDMGAQKSFIVEGNIGAGKSTFLNMLKQYLNIQIMLEPHEQWQNVGGYNLLDLFYKDPKRWAYSFQSYAFISRIMTQEAHMRTNPYLVQILERSIFSDRYCFASNAYELGYMNELEWKIYREWFSWLVETYLHKPDGFIYLRTNPKVCYERLKKRSRNEEATVSLEYIAKIHEKHENWLIEKKEIAPSLAHVPVLILECDADFEHNKAEQEQHVEQVGAFILSYLPTTSCQSPISPLT